MLPGGRPPIDVKSRLLKFGGFLLVWGLIIAVRLSVLQLVQYREWAQRAEHEHQRTVEIAPQRGIIYDRSGQELAMTVPVDSIFAVPSEIPDQKNTAALLAGVTGEDSDVLLERMQSQKNFAWVSRKVDQDVADRVRALGLRGIYFQKELKRFYPKRGLAAQVLGYVGMEDTGLAGVEHSYQGQLNGAKGRVVITMDARRKWFGHVEQPPQPGSNVVLTVDEKIQFIAEKELAQAMEETQAEAGTVVVQNPRTGEILALANAPSFNPNLAHEITPPKLKDHALSDVYEPGSVFKTVAYSALFDLKLGKPEDIVDCDPGYIQIGGIRIHDSHHIGTVTLEKAYAESSDVAAVKMALRLGPDRFYKYIRDYGFGAPTKIELPGETRGLVHSPSHWQAATIGSMAIGQGVGVTPVQVVSMMSTIANDGVYSPPRIVAAITPPDQGYRRIEFHPQGQRRVISSYTAALMRRLTEEVVLEGTARRAILNGYTSAGKTGTAQKVDPHTHAYSKTDYMASFVGFAPVNNAAVTIAVILDTPRGLHQGGQVSAPVFKRIAEQVLAYYGVPHDVEPKSEPARRVLVAHAAEKDREDAQAHAPGEALDMEGAANDDAGGQPAAATTTATGNVAQAAAGGEPPLQAPAAPGIAHPPLDARGGSVVLDVSGASTVPSLLGLTMREAIGAAHKAGFELQVAGSGTAREQQPPAGSYLPPGSKIAVRFAR